MSKPAPATADAKAVKAICRASDCGKSVTFAKSSKKKRAKVEAFHKGEVPEGYTKLAGMPHDSTKYRALRDLKIWCELQE